MENNQEMQKLMKKQLVYARIQCVFAVVAAVCCLVLLLTVLRVMPQVQEIAQEVQAIGTQAETVLTNLETVTEKLAQVDLAGMVNDMDALVASSQTGVEEALKKIENIDIDALNKAIQNLSAVVEPLAKFFNAFG